MRLSIGLIGFDNIIISIDDDKTNFKILKEFIYLVVDNKLYYYLLLLLHALFLLGSSVWLCFFVFPRQNAESKLQQLTEASDLKILQDVHIR